jgi:hypothetical protein
VNAYTATTLNFTMPAANTAVQITVQDTSWVTMGQMLYIEGAGYMRAFGTFSGTVMAVNNVYDPADQEYLSNTAPGVTIVAGAKVSPAGIQGPRGLAAFVQQGVAAPTSTPGAGQYGIYLQGGGTYWTWDGLAGGPWVDTGINLTGPQGNPGTNGMPGANGYSPVPSFGSGLPSGGNDGDFYFRQVNPGLITVYTRTAGFWNAGPSVLGNRLLGYSTTDPTPNPSSLPANAGDSWWTQIGSIVTLFVFNGISWATAVSFSTAGGGGSDTFQTVSDNSAGQLTGNRVWNLERSIQGVVRSVVTVAPSVTIFFDTAYQEESISLLHDFITFNFINPTASRNMTWSREIVNNTGSTITIGYTSGRWTKNPGITQPTSINTGERVVLHFRALNGKMNITLIEQNVTAI